jgi:thioredoxin 1
MTVVCYCAAWCDTCTQYREQFDALAKRWPTHTFVWIDIEENSELLDDEDVENFPTILLQTRTGNIFFGPMLPYIGHLERLLVQYQQTPATIDTGPGQLAGLLAAAA